MSTGSQFVAMSKALGVMSATWPFRVTFKRATTTKGTSGGNLVANPAAIASDIPCIYRPSSGSERELAGKPIAGISYTLFVPGQHESSLVQVDSECTATIAATTGGEPERTLNVIAPLRRMGLMILVLCSIEE